MKNNYTRIICLLAGMLVGALTVQASTFIGLTADELIEGSDSIVQGRVVGLESEWTDSGRLIVTYATIQVTETIVGESKNRIVIQTPGGTVGDFTVEALGFPQLTRGEEVILFLSADDGAQFSQIVGHQQGHVEVVTRQDGVVLAVSRVDEGASLLTPSGQPVPAMPSTELGLFKSRLRSHATRIGKSVNP